MIKILLRRSELCDFKLHTLAANWIAPSSSFPRFWPFKELPCFMKRLSLLVQGIWGVQWRENRCFLVWFSLLLGRKRQGKESQRRKEVVLIRGCFQKLNPWFSWFQWFSWFLKILEFLVFKRGLFSKYHLLVLVVSMILVVSSYKTNNPLREQPFQQQDQGCDGDFAIWASNGKRWSSCRLKRKQAPLLNGGDEVRQAPSELDAAPVKVASGPLKPTPSGPSPKARVVASLVVSLPWQSDP